MIHVMSYKMQGKHVVCSELPISTVGCVVAREPVGFREFCGSNREGSRGVFFLFFFSKFLSFPFFLDLGLGLGLGLLYYLPILLGQGPFGKCELVLTII